jgi:hypothetical protein
MSDLDDGPTPAGPPDHPGDSDDPPSPQSGPASASLNDRESSGLPRSATDTDAAAGADPGHSNGRPKSVDASQAGSAIEPDAPTHIADTTRVAGNGCRADGDPAKGMDRAGEAEGAERSPHGEPAGADGSAAAASSWRDRRRAARVRRQVSWERWLKAATPWVAAFVAAVIALSEALPPLANDVDGLPLLVVLVAGSLAVTAAVIAARTQHPAAAVVATVLLVAVVISWVIVGNRDQQAAGDGQERETASESSSRTTDEPLNSREVSTTTTTTTTPGADGGAPAGNDAPDSGGGTGQQADPPGPTAPNTTGTSPPTTAAPVPCTTLAKAASVRSTQGLNQPHIADVTYTVDAARDPYIEISARLVGTLGPSQELYVVKTADPSTFDSTPEHNPGSVGWFMSNETPPGSGGCFAYPYKRMAYPCAGGVTFRFYFAAIEAATADSLLAQRESHPVGMPSESFQDNPGVHLLGHIEVPTTPHSTCSG